jgi:hypothetical protein
VEERFHQRQLILRFLNLKKSILPVLRQSWNQATSGEGKEILQEDIVESFSSRSILSLDPVQDGINNPLIDSVQAYLAAPSDLVQSGHEDGHQRHDHDDKQLKLLNAYRKLSSDAMFLHLLFDKLERIGKLLENQEQLANIRMNSSFKTFSGQVDGKDVEVPIRNLDQKVFTGRVVQTYHTDFFPGLVSAFPELQYRSDDKAFAAFELLLHQLLCWIPNNKLDPDQWLQFLEDFIGARFDRWMTSVLRLPTTDQRNENKSPAKLRFSTVVDCLIDTTSGKIPRNLLGQLAEWIWLGCTRGHQTWRLFVVFSHLSDPDIAALRQEASPFLKDEKVNLSSDEPKNPDSSMGPPDPSLLPPPTPAQQLCQIGMRLTESREMLLALRNELTNKRTGRVKKVALGYDEIKAIYDPLRSFLWEVFRGCRTDHLREISPKLNALKEFIERLLDPDSDDSEFFNVPDNRRIAQKKSPKKP